MKSNTSPKRKKILILSHSGGLGGAELSMLRVLEDAQKALDIDIHLVVPAEGSLTETARSLRWKVHTVDYSGWAWQSRFEGTEDVYRESLRNLLAIEQLHKLLKDIKPQLAITNTLVAPWLAIAASQTNTAHAWFIREFGDLDHKLYFEQGRSKTFQDIAKLSDLIITNSQAVLDYTQRHSKATDDKLQLLYTPFDIAAIRRQAAHKDGTYFSSGSDGLKLIVVGRLTKSKGQLDAVEAVGILKQKQVYAELCLIGSMDDEAYVRQLKKRAAALGVADTIHFIDHIPNPLAAISQADVGVMTSANEAFGRTTFECLALGKPVVGSNAGGTREQIKSGTNGFLYRPGNAKELAGHLVGYAHDKALLARHAKGAKEFVAAYSLEARQQNEAFHAYLRSRVTYTPKQVPYFSERIINFADVAFSFRAESEEALWRIIRQLQAELEEKSHQNLTLRQELVLSQRRESRYRQMIIRILWKIRQRAVKGGGRSRG